MPEEPALKMAERLSVAHRMNTSFSPADTIITQKIYFTEEMKTQETT
jgi:hypothetical protein